MLGIVHPEEVQLMEALNVLTVGVPASSMITSALTFAHEAPTQAGTPRNRTARSPTPRTHQLYFEHGGPFGSESGGQGPL